MTTTDAPGAITASPSVMQTPKVSVCIPAYQAAAYLQPLLDSVLSQAYDDFEVVVIDNHSTDGTSDILARVDDPRLRVMRNPATLPFVENWNLLVSQSRGEFVKLVCADDLLKPGCLAAQASVLDNNPDVALVSVKCDFIDDNERLIVPARGLDGIEGQVTAEGVVRRIVRNGGNPIGAPVAGMFRRADFDRVGGFTADFPFLSDIHLWVRLLGCGDFYGIPATHASFRVRGGSMSGLTSAWTQLAQSLDFEKSLARDPRWDLSQIDLLRGWMRCHEQTLRRMALFGLTKWRVARRDPGPVRADPRAGTDLPSTVVVDTLTVVICAYTTQRWDELCPAVESVLAQDFPVLGVVVVIDHCPELYRLARDRFGARGRVTVLESNGERGLSGARNTGVGAARGDVVAFLDDDAVAEPGWAHALMRHYRDPRVAAVGGYAAPVWPTGARPHWMPAEFDWVVGCSYTGQPTELAEVRNPLGCNMSIRRSVFDDIGGFRSEVGRVGNHPVGGEETELCIRIRGRKPEARVLYDPDAVVRHHVSCDRATLRYFRRRCYHEGISKAVVTEIADVGNPLFTERLYTTRTLPRGVLRELAAPRKGGFRRAGVMAFGLAATTAGYLRAKTQYRFS
ncbi:glycosyltransferase [Mycolicibacterium sp. jd]|uniref:glycosyltransferase n=1 Tax=unclassified Mycolicibacterium TaxID=2636767 RepID=UPI00298CF958|nr:glycosyltransferase [Mycolicibacterium sp. D5.8-2]MDW5610190.1 glycosyltransferase [Mycolicibacterium sp. D5.8-2]